VSDYLEQAVHSGTILSHFIFRSLHDVQARVARSSPASSGGVSILCCRKLFWHMQSKVYLTNNDTGEYFKRRKVVFSEGWEEWLQLASYGNFGSGGCPDFSGFSADIH
jgi:hypothetical protein